MRKVLIVLTIVAATSPAQAFLKGGRYTPYWYRGHYTNVYPGGNKRTVGQWKSYSPSLRKHLYKYSPY